MIAQLVVWSGFHRAEATISILAEEDVYFLYLAIQQGEIIGCEPDPWLKCLAFPFLPRAKQNILGSIHIRSSAMASATRAINPGGRSLWGFMILRIHPQPSLIGDGFMRSQADAI